MRLGLLVTQGSQRGRYLDFEEEKPFWIGRSKKNDFVLRENTKISSRHCCLIREGSQLELMDQSRNGTFLNGYPFHQEKALLKNTDIFCIEDVHFQVLDMERSSPSVSSPHSASPYSVTFDLNRCVESIQKRQTLGGSPIPLQLGPYFVIEKVGSGTFGTLYKALDFEKKRLVALKVLRPLKEVETDFIGRFLREAELLKKIHHPSIIQWYGAQFRENATENYIALEYFQGVNLRDHLRIHGPMPWKKVCVVLLQLVKALDSMHQKGIIHRDIKPSNILYNGVQEVAKIVDLGLGKCILEKERESFCITAPHSSLGTPHFMPLEQWQNAKDVKASADIYSLGATLYFLLTAKVPYSQYPTLLEVYHALLKNQLIPLRTLVSPEVPEDFLERIEMMMALDEEDREISLKEMIPFLESLLESEEI
jgi:serine/threonine protein kinase